MTITKRILFHKTRATDFAPVNTGLSIEGLTAITYETDKIVTAHGNSMCSYFYHFSYWEVRDLIIWDICEGNRSY